MTNTHTEHEREAFNRIADEWLGYKSIKDDHQYHMMGSTLREFASRIRQAALCWADTNSDYLESRTQIAKLSGVPTMAITFDKHLEVLAEKLQAARTSDARVRELDSGDVETDLSAYIRTEGLLEIGSSGNFVDDISDAYRQGYSDALFRRGSSDKDLIEQRDRATGRCLILSQKCDDFETALRDIAGLNDVDGNSMMCDTEEECRDRAKKALSSIPTPERTSDARVNSFAPEETLAEDVAKVMYGAGSGGGGGGGDGFLTRLEFSWEKDIPEPDIAFWAKRT